MPNPKIKSISFSEMKDKYIGNIGSEEREKYEYKVRKTLSQTKKKPSR